MLNFSDIINDPDFAQEFTIYRSSGAWIDGRWTENEPDIISMYGVIWPLSAKEIEQVPEGDRVKGMMGIQTASEIFVTHAEPVAGTSDKLLWNGNYHRLFNITDWRDFGFFTGTAARIEGD